MECEIVQLVERAELLDVGCDTPPSKAGEETGQRAPFAFVDKSCPKCYTIPTGRAFR